jgi:hypothetical protein
MLTINRLVVLASETSYPDQLELHRNLDKHSQIEQTYVKLF